MDRKTPSSILIVGEDSNLFYLLRSYARRSACQTVFSSPGNKVVEIAERDQPAAIILDMDLPSTKGWTLLRALKANQSTQKIPVVICTWLDEQERGIREGASVYLRMPILYADFLEVLNWVGVHMKSENG